MSARGREITNYNYACHAVQDCFEQIEQAKQDPRTTRAKQKRLLERFDDLVDKADNLRALIEARDQHKPVGPGGGVMSGDFSISEPDLYTEHNGRSFFTDLYRSEIKREPASMARINAHQAHEVEKRAVTSATLGGIVPPQYLVDLYAKASRGGRVLADQLLRAPLPDLGLSVVIPRLTQGLAAAAQTTQNSAVVTQDPTEADLTVAVNTIAGYSPVSRQAIERAAYNDTILFEDLTARYWSILDTYCISGSGSNNQPLGLLNVSSICTSTVSTQTVSGIYPKIADVIQQIGTAMGGIGYTADKVFLHPRRWGFFEAAVDSSGRPLITPSGPAQNPIASDTPGADRMYGLVGSMHGLQVYVDPNLPITLGASTNSDPIIVLASRAIPLLERATDPLTLSFEQQAGTSLQVQLVVYGYLALASGRYPSAIGVVSGCTTPTF